MNAPNDKFDQQLKLPDESEIIYNLLENDIKQYIAKRKEILLLLFGGLILGMSLAFISVYWLLLSGFVLIYSIFFLYNFKINKKVNKIGVINIPYSKMNIEEKTIWVDRSGVSESVEFIFPNLSNDKISKAYDNYIQLKSLTQSIPIILDSENSIRRTSQTDLKLKAFIKTYAEENHFIQYVSNIKEIFNDTEEFNVELPIIKVSNNDINAIVQAHNNNPVNIIETYNIQAVSEELDKMSGVIKQYGESKITESFDIDKIGHETNRFLEEITPKMNYTVRHSQAFNYDMTETIMFNLLNTAYNYYCPYCNEERYDKLLNTKYNYGDNNDDRVTFPNNTRLYLVSYEDKIWQCPLCESSTSNPIPVHKMLDELFTPTYDKLYEENLKERLSIYNTINDQKRKYVEKAESQYAEIYRENRHKRDDLKGKLYTIAAEIEADEYSIQSLKDIMAKYQKISDENARTIEEDIYQIKNEVLAENERAKNEIERIVAKKKEETEKTLENYATLERKDQAERDKLQRKMITEISAIREIEETRAEREGINEATEEKFLGIFTIQGKSERRAKQEQLSNNR